MKTTVKNIFGTGELYDTPVGKKIYVTCAACLSIYAEFASWALDPENENLLVGNPQEADCIVVLGCQVTDLAVLNDFLTLERLQKQNPSATFMMGGCLARRFDIDLPETVLRLNHCRKDGTDIRDIRYKIHWEAPYWVDDFRPSDHELADGHLFRDNCYPLRIGSGCKNKCKFCTIRHTRGTYSSVNTKVAMKEFLANDQIVLVADSPSADQILFWADKALEHEKPISIRNLEPDVAYKVFNTLRKLSVSRLLQVLHIPIQSDNVDVLQDMGRNANTTIALLNQLSLIDPQTTLATNIIVRYKQFPDPSPDISGIFEYISWNPYWDGVWNRSCAEVKFDLLFHIHRHKLW